MTPRERRVRELHRRRPRNRFVTRSIWLAAALSIGAWFIGGFRLDTILGERRLRNLDRFLGELVPFRLRQDGVTWSGFWDWCFDLWSESGSDAVGTTLAISVVAIVFAGLAGTAFAFLAARNVAHPEPFLPSGRRPRTIDRVFWFVCVTSTRSLMTFLRAIPEYVWAFILVMLIGVGAWPAIGALALHNAGILGRLGAEVVENADPDTPRALRGLGAGRGQIAAGALFPLSLNRFLLYFFYRWETCVREATVLGMLGIVSLGYWVRESRAGNRYDEMLFFVVLGILIVLVGDVVSAFARARIRRAT